VVARLWHGYAAGKLTYLLSDILADPRHGPLLWYIVTPDDEMQSLVTDPTRAAAHARPDAFHYRWAGLRPPDGERWPSTGWTRVIYVLQTGIETPEQLRVRGTGPNERRDTDWMTALRTCGAPLTTIPARQDCDDCGF